MKLLIILLILLVILILLPLSLIAPGPERDYSAWKGLMIAHRGLHDENIPENSMAAFRNAVASGYGVELDVQYTLDGKLVVFHDPDLNRMCGTDKKVRDCSLEELQSYRLKNTSETIPLFSEVLKELGNVPLVCEIKNHSGNINSAICEDTYNLIRDYKGMYCIESFSPFLVKWFKDNHPEIIRGQLSCDMKKEKMSAAFRIAMTHLLVNAISRPDFIAYRHHDVDKLGFRICSRLFHPLLFAWTARGDAEQVHAWKYFDSVIFEINEDNNPTE